MRTLVRREQLDLDPLRQTLLLTLYAKAVDARLPQPILGDDCSAELADKIDYDFARLKVKPSLVCSTALRTKKLDQAVREFVARHPDAVVLDLGCGFDPRVVRCDPPAGVDWYDIDFPDVLGHRERLLPGRPRLVGADLTTPGWLDQLPRDRPAMIIAEGLVPFLPGDSFAQLTRRLTGHFGSGELAINGYTRLAAWTMRFHPSIKAIGITAASGFDDAREPENWGARLTLAEEQLLTRDPDIAAFPRPVRVLARIMSHSTRVSREGARILRYEF
ncbi:MAG: class I SAM-dependent methyltransferase [Microlunatus sp.]|nr:class I SAM-dependent methyltransferase [Microlunatus sp.]